MPNIYFAPPARPDPYAFANRDALMQVFDVIGKSKRENFETELLKRYLSGEKDFSSLMGQEEPEGFFGRMWDVVNPKGTYRGGVGGLSPFTQRVMRQAMGVDYDVGAMPWAATQMTSEQRQNWLDNYGRPITILTGQKLLTNEKRENIAETEYLEKVEMSSAERSTAKKGVEEIFESTPLGAARPFGIHAGIKDYEKPTMMGMYKQWLTEQGYETKTPRQRKSLDEIWDGKMNLMNKTGFKFKDKERGRLSKNEIWWDPNDPDVIAIRKGVVEAAPGMDIGEEARKRTAQEAGYRSDEGLLEGTLEVGRTMPKAPRPELEEVWPKLTDEQKSKVTRALMNGATTDEIKAALELEGIK